MESLNELLENAEHELSIFTNKVKEVEIQIESYKLLIEQRKKQFIDYGMKKPTV